MDTVKERVVELLNLEPLIALTVFSVVSFIFYKIFLRKLSEERHKNLSNLFRELVKTYALFLGLWIAQFFLREGEYSRFFIYFGIAAVVMGSVFFVRTIRVVVYEYLFFNSMTLGVPALLVDMVTLLFSIFVAAWLSTSVFGVRWAPLLATSAIVSVVLGLALQDTLGNLFAGLALQFDKPYEIGDWIEVHSEKNAYAGEVHEITWRATVLNGFYDEVITLPNRMTSQSEISNFSARAKPIYRAASVYMDVNAPDEEVKAVFIEVLKQAKGVLQHLDHYVMLRDLTEKGAHWRLFYPVASYSKQFMILDGILMNSQKEFKKRGIQVARLRGDIQGGSEATPPSIST